MSARPAFAAVVAAAGARARVPGSGSPRRRRAGGEGDGPDPRFDVPLDADALRAAESAVPADDTYATEWVGGSPLEQGNLKAAGQLYRARAFPVLEAPRARWLLAVRNDGAVVLVRRR